MAYWRSLVVYGGINVPSTTTQKDKTHLDLSVDTLNESMALKNKKWKKTGKLYFTCLINLRGPGLTVSKTLEMERKKKNISKLSIYGNWWHTDTVWIQNIQKVLHAGQIVALQTDHRSSAMENPVFNNNNPVVTQPLWTPLCLNGALGAVGHVVDQDANEGGHHFSGHPRTTPCTLQRGNEGTNDQLKPTFKPSCQVLI